MKFGIKSYWAPTPKKIRKVADALLAAATFAGGSTVLNGHPIVGTVIFVIGFVAKFASNFFEDESAKPE